ncbi:Transposase, IS116/IS110/IS902 [Legionella lansingensis]|uniref:Transposase n=4 Tax=Legionella lansingensis TaxID=45067 RepID=A0A0W0V757_9GAMM|nr:IS110 family transposase [Legionella lansingensis]KTD15947.1 transposase [Legionella lansingensis]SNV47616.1 Transposase, IS116/IS110/IS902 [Legionella lansingensis]SNV48736.1 Transposase, IS116/IS110/IS902 [Legionella lansingensis]
MSAYEFVGVDIAKDKFDSALEINNRCKHAVFSNNEQGYKAFLKWLEQYTISPWVCMEATGHYSEGLADFLAEKGIRVSVVNPFQIKSFAKASLARNKNDRIDAKIIAQFGQRMEPRIYQSNSAEQKEIRELTKVLDMLKAQVIQLTNQLHSIRGHAAQKSLKKMIEKLEQEIKRIQQQIDELINNNQQLKEKFELLLSIKGIGKLTAYHVLARIPDIQCFQTAKQFAAYMGITPKQQQSGSLIGKTTISRLGDSRLRKALYMAALVAKRYNKSLLPFINKLQTKGKTPKIIICAVMRKLAHIIFGVLKNKQPFNENVACF